MPPYVTESGSIFRAEVDGTPYGVNGLRYVLFHDRDCTDAWAIESLLRNGILNLHDNYHYDLLPDATVPDDVGFAESYDGKLFLVGNAETLNNVLTRTCSDCGEPMVPVRIAHIAEAFGFEYPPDILRANPTVYYLCEDCHDERYDTCEYCGNEYEVDYGCGCRNIIDKYVDTQFLDSALYYFGIETEFEGYDDNGGEIMANAVNDLFPDMFQFRRDGSLDDYGVEIVSHAMSYDLFMQTDWDKYMETVNANGYGATSNGGMHVHVSREAFDDSDHLARAIYVAYNNYDTFLGAGGTRSARGANSWARRIHVSDIEVALGMANESYPERYCMVNLSNHSTVEFRIFGSPECGADITNPVKMIHQLIESTRNIEAEDEVKDISDNFANAFAAA